MREIKFRAWAMPSKLTSDVPVGYIIPWEKLVTRPESLVELFSDKLSNHVIMQYTGLKAKDVEVYEGDIVKEDGPEGRVYEVRWADNGWCLAIGEYHTRHFRDVFKMEIIGNIYENPELLKTLTPNPD